MTAAQTPVPIEGPKDLENIDVPARFPRWQGWRHSAQSRFGAEWPFLLVLSAGALLRGFAMLGFRPIMWFNDGFEYLGVALRFHAYSIRPVGYSGFLRVLLPFHSFALVALLQHAMGLATAVLLYALLRKWGVPRVLATVASIPQLLDIHQVQLEHVLLSDTLFSFLVVLGVVLLAWRSTVSPLVAGAAGLALAAAVLTRTVGIPLIILGGLYLLIRWSGWRPLLAYVMLALLPLGGYAAWFHHQNGHYALNTADGIFLYSRVMHFANCDVIKPSASLAVLCDSRPIGSRPPSSNYIWHASPLDRLPGHGGNKASPEQRFSTVRNDRALSFAIKAIVSQPGAYLRTGTRDLLRSFTWFRDPFPNADVLRGYTFSKTPIRIPSTRVYVPGNSAKNDTQSYEHAAASTRIGQPFAGMLIGYQHVGFVPGPVLAVLLVIAVAGLFAHKRRDRRRWDLLFLLAVALAILVIPDFTAQFDYRYVMPSIPFASAAAMVALCVLVPRWRGIAADCAPDALPYRARSERAADAAPVPTGADPPRTGDAAGPDRTDATQQRQ